MLLNKNGHNKNNNNNLPEINLEYSVNNFDGSVNLDQNNKDVDNFFTVVKSQIVDDNNNEKNNDDGNIEQNFDYKKSEKIQNLANELEKVMFGQKSD